MKHGIMKLITIMVTFLTFNVVASAETTNVARIDNTSYSSLKEAIAAAKAGDTITLIGDTTEDSVMNINVGITINGNGHQIKYTGTSTAFDIRTDSEIVIDNINLESNKRAVTITSSKHNVTIKNSILTVADRGVTVGSDNNQNAILNITDCIIQRLGFSNYDEYVPNDGSRGISLWQYQNSDITIKNTTIQGFSYVINTASQISFNGTKLIIDNSILRGRAGLNVWDSDLDITLTNSEILGINNEKGPSESFANVVLNGSARNTKLDIQNTKFLNYENETGQNNPNALQYMLKVRSINNTISIAKNTSFLDSTKKLEDNISYGIDQYTNIDHEEQIVLENNIQITGGTYSYDAKDFLAPGYESILEDDGMYHVRKIEDHSNTVIELKPLDLNVTVNKAVLGITNTELSKKVLLDTLATTNEVDIENKNAKVTITMDDIQLSETEQEKFEKNKKIEKATLAGYFDITIHVIDQNTNNIIGNLTTLSDKMTFTILLPSELQKVEKGYQRKYYLLREHNGNYDLLETKLSNNGTVLAFESNQFSTYALLYVDEKIVNNPNTSDGIISYFLIGFISVIGMTFMVLYLKKNILKKL